MTPIKRAQELMNFWRERLAALSPDVAAAIRDAMFACANVADRRQHHHDRHCRPKCRCADGR